MEQLEKVVKGLQTAVDSDWMWRKADYIAMCCKDAIALINAQQERIAELEAGPKWISVKDRLPRSMANKVLVYVQHEDLVGYIGFGHYEKFHGEEMWYDLERGEQFAKNGYIVTHWMLLPEPPKEEDNANQT